MRIVVVGPTHPFRGGIAHFTTLLVENLKSRHEVCFISYLRQYPQFLFPGRTQIDSSAEFQRVENERLISFMNPLSWRKAARRMVEFNPDVVVFSWVSPAMAAQFRYIAGYVKRRSPRAEVVFYCHNVTQHESRPLDTALTRLALARGDRFVVTGEGLRASLHRLLPGAAVEVVPLPALDIFAGGAREKNDARRELGFDENAAVALYFGFVRPYKGLVHLLGAMTPACRRVPSLRLLVVGEFWEGREEYDDQVRLLGLEERVTTHDRYVPNEEVGLYFGAADVVVLPYVQASASGIVQVAYSFGKPVITTTVGALPEMVSDGVTGYLVPPADPAALAMAITRFFEGGDPERFAREIERFRSRFTWERLVDAIGGQTQ